MDVLLVDTTQYSPTPPLFADCLRPSDTFFDEARFYSKRWLFAPRAVGALNQAFLETTLRVHPDVIVIVKGLRFQPSTLGVVKRKTGALLVNFSTDDPWNLTVSSREIRTAISQFDLYCSPRRATIPDILRAGCRRAEFVMFGYKPTLHYPSVPMIPTADVTIVGGADEDRVPYADALARLRVRLSLYGGYWDRIGRLQSYDQGIVRGRRYSEALRSSKIVVCLVRRANRDDHKMLTFEAPACGAFTLFEDTTTHRDLFGALQQNIFFRTPEDLANQVRYWLAYPEQRERTADAQRDTIRSSGHTWQDRFHQIMAIVEEIRGGMSKGTGDAAVV